MADTHEIRTKLTILCGKGDAAQLDEVLKDKDYHYMMTLMIDVLYTTAFSQSYFDVLDVLLKHGADIDIDMQYLYFYNAYKSGNLSYLHFANSHGFNKRDDYKEIINALYNKNYELAYDQADCLKFVVDEGADYKETLKYDLRNAIEGLNPKIFAYLMSLGGDINETVEDPGSIELITYLMFAVKTQNIELIELIITYNPDISALNQGALREAITKHFGHNYPELEIVELLLNHGADPKSITDEELDDITAPQADEIRNLIRNTQGKFNLHAKLSSQLAEKEPVKKKKRDF